MRTDPLPYEVRDIVFRAFQELGIALFSPDAMDEAVLFSRGRYAARTYKFKGYMAMWLVRFGVVQFYDAEGNMVLTMNLLEELEPQRMAA